jgi:hypothetical protein
MSDTARKRCYKRARLAILARLGNKCIKCTFSDWRALQIDHKDGGAASDLRSIGCSSSSYKFLLYLMTLSDEELTRRYQLLCANCNWIKRHENEEWRKGGRTSTAYNSYQLLDYHLRKMGVSASQILKEMKEN